jgi:3-oxoacyl-[acyl-carrier protein] reductase
MAGVAVVTGAGRGIGRAIALALAARGFDVALAGLEAEPPDLGPFDAAGRRARYYPFDLAALDGHGPLLDRVERELGPIDCLVNNAGVTSLVRGDLLDLSPESFDRCCAVNLRGTFFLTQAAARRMLAAQVPAGLRSIVTVSSVNAEIVGENRGDYCMTKAALAMMNKLYASRLAEAGIACYEVRPGIIRTEMTAPATGRYDPFIRDGGVPVRRWGEPADVGRAAAALAAGDLPYMTGTHIDIAGGMQLHRVCKYPPAKPGALGREPLEAVGLVADAGR